jgi:hypothetical protein
MVFFKNKKGGALTEAAFIILVLIVVAVSWVTVVYILDVMNPVMQDELKSSESKAAFQDYYDRTPSNLDTAFVVILVLLWIFAVVSAFFIDTHPVWFVVSLFALIFILAGAAIVSNTYIDFHDSLELASSLPKIYFVMDHLVEFIIAISASVMLALFGKSQL